MGKRVNVNLEELKALYNRGLSDNEIAKRLNCSRKTIAKRRKKLNLPVNFWGAIDEEKANIITEMLSKSKSVIEISKTLNICHTTIEKFKKEKGLHSAFEAKMSEKDIEEAMKMAKEGYMDSEIAKKFGVTQHNICLHRKRRDIKSRFSYDKISKIDNKKFEVLFNQGLTDEKIARELNMSPDGIYSHRMRHGYYRDSYVVAKENPLTENNLEIILGIMMGDASMERVYKNTRMTYAHCPKQKEYGNYVAKNLSNLNPSIYHCIPKPHKKTGKIYESYWWNFPTNPSFNILYEHFYKDGKKRIPVELFKNFTWQSLAYMYMDDGNKESSGGKLATNCFSVEDLKAFQKFLQEKFNIDTTILKDHGLYIKAKSFRHMKSNIKPYICECMMYKINK